MSPVNKLKSSALYYTCLRQLTLRVNFKLKHYSTKTGVELSAILFYFKDVLPAVLAEVIVEFYLTHGPSAFRSCCHVSSFNEQCAL